MWFLRLHGTNCDTCCGLFQAVGTRCCVADVNSGWCRAGAVIRTPWTKQRTLHNNLNIPRISVNRQLRSIVIPPDRIQTMREGGRGDVRPAKGLGCRNERTAQTMSQRDSSAGLQTSLFVLSPAGGGCYNSIFFSFRSRRNKIDLVARKLPY